MCFCLCWMATTQFLLTNWRRSTWRRSTRMELKQHSSHETAWRWGGVWLRKTNFGIVPDSFLFFFGFFILNSKTAYWTLAGQTKSRHRSACQDSRWLVVGSSSHYWSVDSSLFLSYLSLGHGKDRVAVLGWYFKVYDLWARCFLQEKVPPPTLLLMIPLECSNPISGLSAEITITIQILCNMQIPRREAVKEIIVGSDGSS